MVIYMASYETKKNNYDVLLDENCGLLLTYFYEKQTSKVLPEIKKNGHKGLVIIDSGAHSFFEEIGVSVTAKKDKKGGKITRDPDTYFRNYIEWVKKNYDYFDFFVELDIQEIVSQKKVDEWREIYVSEGIAEKCVMVHHSFNTNEEFDNLINNQQKSNYIGLEGIRPNSEIMDYNLLLKAAYEKGVRVHGFAFTRSKLLYKYPFYSVDSTSWTTSVLFGAHSIFMEGNMTNISCKNDFFKHNIPIEMHPTNRGKANEKKKMEIAHLEYIKMELFFTKLWERRGVNWNSKVKEYAK